MTSSYCLQQISYDQIVYQLFKTSWIFNLIWHSHVTEISIATDRKEQVMLFIIMVASSTYNLIKLVLGLWRFFLLFELFLWQFFLRYVLHNFQSHQTDYTRMCFAKFWPFYLRHQHSWHASRICTMKDEHRIYTDIVFFVFDLDLFF